MIDILFVLIFGVFLGILFLGIEVGYFYYKNGRFPSDDDITYTEDD